MQIYTGMCSGKKKLEKIDKYNLGFMISSTPNRLPCDECKGRRCALDNGAYSCWVKGYPFMESYFWRAMEKCYAMSIKLDFIVIPDIVGGGVESFKFSLTWMDRLRGGSLALVIQAGTPISLVESHMPLPITTIFIGGSHLWDWEDIAEWQKWSKAKELTFHIGRVGNLNDLHKAKQIGADSVDSTNFTRNEAWETIERFDSGPAACPSCGVIPDINERGMVSHYDSSGCMMMGMFTPKVWEHHAKSGSML